MAHGRRAHNCCAVRQSASVVLNGNTAAKAKHARLPYSFSLCALQRIILLLPQRRRHLHQVHVARLEQCIATRHHGKRCEYLHMA